GRHRRPPAHGAAGVPPPRQRKRGRVALFGVAGPAPKLEARFPPLVAPPLHISEDLARDPPHRRQVEAVVRHRRFHIGLHTDRFLRSSRERHLAAEPGDYGAGRYVAFTGPSSSTLSTHVDPFSNPPAPALTRLRWTRSSTSSHTISPCVLSTAPSSFWSVRSSSRPLSPSASARESVCVIASRRALASASTACPHRRYRL